jgi:hypothetical protein
LSATGAQASSLDTGQGRQAIFGQSMARIGDARRIRACECTGQRAPGRSITVTRGIRDRIGLEAIARGVAAASKEKAFPADSAGKTWTPSHVPAASTKHLATSVQRCRNSKTPGVEGGSGVHGLTAYFRPWAVPGGHPLACPGGLTDPKLQSFPGLLRPTCVRASTEPCRSILGGLYAFFMTELHSLPGCPLM